ncbi:MAG: chromate efflux transporter [Chloroflexota bacterium]|nr:chromate efflux transporter [Chloroflexota bacterium]
MEDGRKASSRDLLGYFLRLGTLGFGGPVALASAMYRDLVERRAWITKDEYELSLALAQVMPGPLAAQLAMAIGYFMAGVGGATLAGVAFVIPSFLMVVGLAWLYVGSQGLWWVGAIFYTVGASVIAIIALSSYRLARSTNARDPLRWAISGLLFVITVLAQAELAEFFLLAGVVMVMVRARPAWLRGPALRAIVPLALVPATVTGATPETLVQVFLFFAKAGAFVFGSGLAIVPFLHQGVVQEFGWLDERQFLDAIAVAIITPGPVVITVAFIGFLVAGPLGATAAALGMFAPVYVLTVVPAPWFKRHRDNAQLRTFAAGATAAATGAIAGAVVLLAQRAITDLVTAAVAIVTLGVLWRWRPPEPLVILASAAIGVALAIAGRS